MRIVPVVIVLAVGACGGGDAAQPDAVIPDADSHDISGSTPITGHVSGYAKRHFDMYPAIAGAFVRIETADNDFLETTAAADGTFTFMVDPTRGPFVLTAAQLGFEIVSIREATGDLGEIRLHEATDVSHCSLTLHITGNSNFFYVRGPSVDGRAGDATETTKQIPAYGPNTPASVVGLALDPTTNQLVNIAATQPDSFAGPTADLTLAFPAIPSLVTTTVHVRPPTTGLVPLAALNPGQAEVFREIDGDERNATLVGTGSVRNAGAGMFDVTLHTTTGDLAPTAAKAYFQTDSPHYTLALSIPLEDNTTAPAVPPISALEIHGDSIGTATMTVHGDPGWQFSEVAVFRLWKIFGPATLDAVPFPHLPTGLSLTQFADDFPASIELDEMRNASSDRPWTTDHHQASDYYSVDAQLVPRGR